MTNAVAHCNDAVLMSSWSSRPGRRQRGAIAIEACDRCGIRAYVRVVLLSGREIYLCREHIRKYERALKELRSRFHELPA